MWASASHSNIRVLRYYRVFLPSSHKSPLPSRLPTCPALVYMNSSNMSSSSSNSNGFAAFFRTARSGGGGRGAFMGSGGGGRAVFTDSGGGGRGLQVKNDKGRSRGRGDGRGAGGSGKDKIDALGRLLTRILRHMAIELNLKMRNDGYVKVDDLLKLKIQTFAHIPLRSHTVDDIKEAVRKDNKQRFGLLEEDGELLIRANQGHTTTVVESERLLKPILSSEEVPVCVHGTYRKNLESILASGLQSMKRLHVHFSRGLPADGQVISGMRRDVNVLIYLDVQKALAEGMKLYISENKVILTEGFDGVVPVKYFEKIESWPDRNLIPF